MKENKVLMEGKVRSPKKRTVYYLEHSLLMYFPPIQNEQFT